MKQTALYPMHIQLKAKMTDFQGWQVPLLYSDATEECHAVRTAAGLFDVGHLGRIEISGAGSQPLLQKTFTRSISKLAEGSALYGIFCNESGRILDDAMLFHLPAGQQESRYLLTVNAVNSGKIISWLRQHAGQDVGLTDIAQSVSQIALQGPRSLSVLERLMGHAFKKMRPRNIREAAVLDAAVLISRTGYTGEHGYELFVPADKAEAVWNGIMGAGKEYGITACGLGCRDVLRMEMGYVMYGNDIDETRTPIEAGLKTFVDFKKEFIGKDALLKQNAGDVQQRLVGFVLLDRGVPKSGGSIFSENREIGVVTSGNHSPHLRRDIGLGYVLSRYAQAGQEIEIEVKDREIAAKIVELPFYRKK